VRIGFFYSPLVQTTRQAYPFSQTNAGDLPVVTMNGGTYAGERKRMTLAEIKAWMKDNTDAAEVKTYIGELAADVPLSGERVVSFLETDDGFKAAKPLFDRYANKAIQTHDEKRAPEIVKQIEQAKAEAKKETEMSFEERTAQSIAELKKQIEDRDAAIARSALIDEIRGIAAEKNVPLELAVDLTNPALTKENATARIELYAKANAAQIQDEVNKRLLTGHKPGSPGTEKPGAADIRKLSFEELVQKEEKGELNDLLQ